MASPKRPASRDWRGLMHQIARAVRDMRGLLGWSQQTLAASARVSQGAISRMEGAPGESFPLYTAVKVLGALADAAHRHTLPLATATEQLLAFAALFRAPLIVAAEVDHELVELLHAFHRLPAERRAAVLHLVAAANELFGRDFTHAPESRTTQPPTNGGD